MLEFIAIFFPTFLSLKILKERTNKEYKELLIYYPIYNLLINMLMLIIVCIYKHGQIISIIDNFNLMDFCLKYMFISSILAVMMPYISEIIKKNLDFNIEIRRDKKNNEKNK